jgi:hypothetical protein
MAEPHGGAPTSTWDKGYDDLSVADKNEVDKDFDPLLGGAVSQVEKLKKKRPLPSLSSNLDDGVQQHMELMNKAAAERAAARAIEKQSEEDRANKRRKEDREYHEQREAVREKREAVHRKEDREAEVAREGARQVQATQSAAVSSALLAFLTAQTPKPQAPL